MAVARCSLLWVFLLVVNLASRVEGSQDVDAESISSDFLQRTEPIDFLGRLQPLVTADADPAKKLDEKPGDKQVSAAAATTASEKWARTENGKVDFTTVYSVRDDFLNNGSVVCEDTSIRLLLRLESSDYQTISNIDFDAIHKKADGYISSQQLKISRLEQGIQKYLSAMLTMEQADANEDLLKQLLTDALNKSFGSVQKAAESSCGLKSKGDTYNDARSAWGAIVATKLKGSKTSLEQVRNICLGMLDTCLGESRPKSEGGDDFCPRLCEELGGKASSLAVNEPEVVVDGQKLTAGKILDSIEQQRLSLKKAQGDLQACSLARADLMRLGRQIQAIKSEVDQQSTRQRTAIQHLNELVDKLEKDGAKLIEQQKRTQAVSARLREAKGEADTLTERVDDQAKEEGDLLEKMQRAQDQLVELMQSVKASGDAWRAVQEFKGDLSITMKGMLQIFRDVVQTPLRDLAEDLDQLDAIKWPKVEDKQSTKDALKKAEALPGKCDAAVKMTRSDRLEEFKEQGNTFQKVCLKLKQSWKTSTQEIVDIVKEKREQAIKAVEVLKADLHELGCSDPVKYKTQIEEGEPEHLRAVLRLFNNTEFYHDYASYWLMGNTADGEARPGTLLKLYQTLKEVYEKGEMESRLEKEQYENLAQQHAKVLAKRQQLEKELTEALTLVRLAGINETEAKDILDEWKADIESLEAMKAMREPEEKQAGDAQESAKEDISKLHKVLRDSIQSSLLALGEFDPDDLDDAGAAGLTTAAANASLVHRRVLLHSALSPAPE